MSTGDSSALARQLADLADADRFSGSVLVTRGNETVFECAAGWADRAYGIPLTPASRFGLASMSKMFTAAAVVSCVRDGLLAPHDRVSSIVPEQRRPQTMPDEVTVQWMRAISLSLCLQEENCTVSVRQRWMNIDNTLKKMQHLSDDFRRS